MKKMLSLILALGLIMSLSACGKVEITMQEIYDAGQTEALLKNHKSVYVQHEIDGKPYSERYESKDYTYECYLDYDWVDLLTDEAYYCYYDGAYERVFALSTNGIADIASFRAEFYKSPVVGEETVYETIESVSKKDGHIIVKSVLGEDALAELEKEGPTAGKYEYTLDAKTYEVISLAGESTYEGTLYQVVSQVTYDVEEPERIKAFLEYDKQTENLRNVTVITNPGTDQEIRQSVQVPKGLYISFIKYDANEEECGLYADAACTHPYEFLEDTESDMTIYVKWGK